ncbi:hypothetical protein MKX03_021268 [Papaver bracteatum]|nr:hypothetical protein MKX03_021268 [Papaver bracteatum]
MSWIRDPELFIYYQIQGRRHYVARIRKQYDISVQESDIYVCGELNIARHFSSFYDDNKIAFNRLLDYLRNQNKYINCQGLVVNYWVRNNHFEYFWSKEAFRVPHCFSPALPAAKEYESTSMMYACTTERDEEMDEILSLRKTVSELKAMNLSLRYELQRERAENSSKAYAYNMEQDQEMAEILSLKKSVSDYKAMNLTLREDLQREVNDRIVEEAEKQSLVKRIFDLETKSSILKDESKRLNNEKYTLEMILATSQDEIASLKDKNKEMAEDLEIWINEVSDLQQQLDREKKGNQSLEIEVAGLKLKLERCCPNGGAAVCASVSASVYIEPWMNGYTVAYDWVPFEDLCVREFSRSGRPLTLAKTVSGAPAFSEDNTTNVHVNYFYRGLLNKRVYPIVIVNVVELIPNKEKARFDPNIWSLFNNAGITYAARKPFESESYSC